MEQSAPPPYEVKVKERCGPGTGSKIIDADFDKWIVKQRKTHTVTGYFSLVGTPYTLSVAEHTRDDLLERLYARYPQYEFQYSVNGQCEIYGCKASTCQHKRDINSIMVTWELEEPTVENTRSTFWFSKLLGY
jgi:hypothetical protein